MNDFAGSLLFEFTGKDATQPVEFLARLGQTTWIA